MSRRLQVCAVGLAIVVAGCAELPVIEDGQCGNYVVDEGEDCDTYPVHPGTSCRMTAPNACRYECAPRADGSQPDCAPGMQCGADFLCRAPSGQVDELGSLDTPGARELLVADLGGSLGAEVIAVLERRLEINYLSVASGLDVLARITEPTVATDGTIPLPVDLSDDGITDLVTPVEGGMIVNVGGPDLKLAPSAHPTLSLIDVGSVAVVFLEVLPQRLGDETLTFVGFAGAGAIAYSDQADAKLLAAISGSPERLAGDMVHGSIAEDPVSSPCDELAFAFVDEPEVLTLEPCRPATVGTGVEWNSETEPSPVALPPGSRVAKGPLLVDLNGDDHLDLLVEAQGCVGCPELLASFGMGDGSFHSKADEVETVPVADGTFAPYGDLVVETNGESTPLVSLPLAVGDLDGDGAQDFVSDHQVWMSRGSTSEWRLAAEVAAESWSLARIADFNANGLLDVVTVTDGATGIRFFNGAPGGFLNEVFIPTAAPIGRAAVGDFDGDLVNDLVISEPRDPAEPAAGDLVSILFGRTAGAPEPPVVMGRLDPVQQIVVGRPGYSGVMDGIDDFSTVSQLPDGSFVFSGFKGRGNRLIRSPFQLATEDNFHIVAYPPRRLAAGQFDDDPHTDLAALTYPFGEPGADEYIFLASMTEEARCDLGHTQEGDPLSADVDWSRAGLVAVDVDGDGRDELLTLAPLDAGGIEARLFQAVGAGRKYAWQQASWHEPLSWSFSRTEDFGASAEHNGRLLLVDLDGDGVEQVVALGFDEAGDGKLWHLAGLSLEGLGEVSEVDLGGLRLRDAAVVEADGDPGQELALLAEDGLYWIGAGRAGLVGVSSRVWDVAGANRLAVGDVDADGLDDVVVAHDGVASILRARPENP